MNPIEVSERYSIPQMPIYPANETLILAFTIIMAAVNAGLLAWWFFSSEKREHGFILPFCLIGGALSAFIEPIFDVLVLFWYPVNDYLVAYTAFGRDIPWFCHIGYAWYVGGMTYFVYRMLCNGLSGNKIWAVFTGLMIADCAGITLLVKMGVGGFYGNQPFNIWGYPLWWAGVDGPQPLLGGMILYWLLPQLQQPLQRMLAGILAPVVSMGAMLTVVWPISHALNTEQSTLITYISGAATFALGTCITWLCIQVINSMQKGNLRVNASAAAPAN